MSTNASWSDLVNLKEYKVLKQFTEYWVNWSYLYFRSSTWASFSSRLKPLRCCENRCCCSKNLLAHRRRHRSSTTSWQKSQIKKPFGRFQSWAQIRYFLFFGYSLQTSKISSPYIRYQLAGLRILYPVETSQDRLALLFHQSVDHRLYRPHWGVVRLWESMRNRTMS